MSLTRFSELYSNYLSSLSDLEHQVYYRTSRGKFLEILRSIHLNAPDPTSILEIGTSYFSVLLSQLYPKAKVATWDLDTSRQSLAEAHGIDFYVGSVLEESSALSTQFDLIIFSEVLEHLQGNPHIAFRHFRDLLKPDGILITTTPNLCCLSKRVKMMLGRTPLERIGPKSSWGGHFREYTRKEVEDMISAVQLDLVSSEHAMYWDDFQFLLQSGGHHFDERGQYQFRQRFAGIRKLWGYPYCAIRSRIVQMWPELRDGMIFVARKG